MAFTISCGDVMPGCTATFEADSETELLDLVSAHAAIDHTEVTLDDHVVDLVKAAIRSS